MIIRFAEHDKLSPEKFVWESVERKGVGHPDTLTDLVAETFSNLYSIYCLKHFGVILNYWVDKILLSGGEAEVTYGDAKIIKPMTMYLFGKVTTIVEGKTIDVDSMFKDAVHIVFSQIFTDSSIFDNIRYVVDINQGVGADFSKDFYKPGKLSNYKLDSDRKKSNDTITCSSYSPYTKAEMLTMYIENYVNSSHFKKVFPATGWDVKVMVARFENNFDITVCIPFIAALTPSFEYYKSCLNTIDEDISRYINELFGTRKGSYTFTININTKDYDKHGYITVYGTAGDKGDYGVVGRGNKFSGVISNVRDTNVEAVCGKSSFRHSGKIYTILSRSLADYLAKKYDMNFLVTFVTQNGRYLNDPSHLMIQSDSIDKIGQSEISDFSAYRLENIESLTEKLIKLNPVEEHIHKTNLLY